MNQARKNPLRRIRRIAWRLAWILAPFPGLLAQDYDVPEVQLPAEEIAQGRNRGIPTWEGTLFGQDSYKPGSYAQIEAVPNPGFEFDRWEGEHIAKPEEAKTFVTMEDHLRIKPHYKRIWNVIAAPDNKEAGKVEGGGNYPDGTEVTLKVTPNEGFKFLGWEGKGIREAEKENLETSIIVDGDHDIVARFENENQDQNQNQNQNQDQNQDQQDQNNQDQNENQDPQDQQDAEDEEPQDPENQDPQDPQDQPQEPEPGEEEPPEPGNEEDPQQESGEPDQEDPPQDPAGGEDSPAGEAPAENQPVPLQMTPEEAVRLLEAMENEEKKLPLFIVTPPENKKDPKKDW